MATTGDCVKSRYNNWEKSIRVMIHECFRNTANTDHITWRLDCLLPTHKSFTALQRALEPTYSVYLDGIKKVIIIKEPNEHYLDEL